VSSKASVGTFLRSPVSEVILDTVRALVVGLDTNGKVRLFNDACVELTGWSRAEAIGADWITNFVPARLRDSVLGTFHSLLEGFGGDTAQNTIMTRRRGERLIQWRNAVIRNSRRQVTLVLATGLDVTEVRQAAREESILNELTASALAGTPLPQALAHMLAALAQYCGWEILAVERYLKQAGQMRFIAVHAPPGAPLSVGLEVPWAETLSASVVRTGQPVIECNMQARPECCPPALRRLNCHSFLCYPIQTADEMLGALCLASSTPQTPPTELRNYLPRVANALALVITRVEAAAQLQESEMRSRAVLDTAADGIITIDERGIVQSFNPAAERIFGFTGDEAIGRNISTFMPSPEAGEHDNYLRRYLKTGKARVVGIGREAVGRRKDGTEFPLDLAVSETRLPTGRLFTGIVRDLTERKSLEAQLRQAQKMEAVGRLAGGVAHDFNNVLTGITGYTQLALRRLEGNDPLRHYLEEIQQAAFRASNLTRQLLTFSRRQVLAPRVLDLRVLISDLTAMLKQVIGEDVELTVKIPPTPIRVRVDSGLMEQALVNLIVNARDAMPSGGTAIIELSDIDLDELDVRLYPTASPGRFALLNVTDSGTGMDQDTLSRAFEPFFTTKEPGRGTGLGLATVYSIVTQSGGAIRVDSELGRGSVFRILLPLYAAADAAASRQAQSATAAHGTETILLVEDEDLVREVNVEGLREQGYRVLAASNGDEALQISRAHPGVIDVLVTDIVMPRMNGRDLAGLLRQNRPRLRVLFMSGYPESEVLEQGWVEPNAHFLQKPFSPLVLSRKVRNMIDASR
jgi:PAS domain S-box-containing protein